VGERKNAAPLAQARVTRRADPPLRQPLDLRAMLCVLMLCIVWGAQQVVMKGVSGDVAPVLQLSLRFAGSAIFFGIWVAVTEGRKAFSDGTLPSGLLLGVMFSLEFLLIGQAIVHTTAAHVVVFLYSAPIFTALGLQFLPEERLGGLQWVGIGIAFFGIVVAFLGPGGRPVADLIVGDLLAVCAGAAWGLSNVVLRRGRVGNAGTAKTVLYQVSTAAILLYGFAAFSDQIRFVATPAAIIGVLFQTVMISIVSYLLWFWLLRHYLTSRLMLFSLMTPFFGVMFGAVFLHDRIDLRFALGSVFVLGGILVVNAQMGRRRAS
jgi:drug/metabolite transporter (DMT)-like permease